MSSNSFHEKIRILAILSCIKTVSAINSYMQNGNEEKAKNLLDNTISELKKVRENIELLKNQVRGLVRELGSIDSPSNKASEIIKKFRDSLKQVILSNPTSARVCIKIQPHLEVMFNTLNNIAIDLNKENPTIKNAALKDAKIYLSYIDSYLTDLLKILKDL